MTEMNQHTPARKRGRRNEPDAPVNALQKQDGRTDKGQFVKGISGNPAGRPQGARGRATMAAAALLDGEAEALTRKAVELALDGDVAALRLCLDRLYPTPKDRPVAVDLPTVETAADLPKLTASILAAVARGELTPQEGNALASIVTAHSKAVDVAEIDARLAALEDARQEGRL